MRKSFTKTILGFIIIYNVIFYSHHLYSQPDINKSETINYNDYDIFNFDFHTHVLLNTLQIFGDHIDWGNTNKGTCFILQRPNTSDTNSIDYILITAKHVLDHIRGDSAKIILHNYIGREEYEDDTIAIQIRNLGQSLWYSDIDSNVDVAALKINLTNKNIGLPINTLADENIFDKFDVHSHDDTIYIYGFPKGKKFPNGLALRESGPIRSVLVPPIIDNESFYCDFIVEQGNSGSPAYIKEINRVYRAYGQDDKYSIAPNFQYILGIITEQGLLDKDKNVTVLTKEGITIIVTKIWGKVIPSFKIKKIINKIP